jgi:hypothetical protein
MGTGYILPGMRSAFGNVRQSFEIDRAGSVIHVAFEYKFGPVAALTLAVNASGMAKISSVMLMTPEEIDAACKKSVSYRPPGR